MLTQIVNLPFWLVVSSYFLLIVTIIFLSLLLSKLCVTLEKKTKLSEATIGVILLGITTSFPELITCISSIFVSPNNGFTALGDIIGSNLFDLFALACCLFYFVIKNKNKQIDKSNFTNILCLCGNTLFCFLACILHKNFTFINHFNFFTLGFIIMFIISTYFLIRHNKNSKKNLETTIRLNKKINKFSFNNIPIWVISLLTLLVSAILIANSYFLTIFAMQINIYLNLDNAFGGAILLGIITSLPEVITCLSLVKHRCYNMLVGNIVGSINFNFTILFLTNILLTIFYQNEMFVFADNNIFWQIIFLLIQCFFLFIYAFTNVKKTHDKWKNIIFTNLEGLSLVIICGCYLCFILIGSL